MRSLTPVALSLLALANGGSVSAGHSGFVKRHSNLARQLNSNSSSSGSNTTEVEMVASAWYTGWHATDFPLSNVSWDKYTQLTYAFGYVGCRAG